MFESIGIEFDNIIGRAEYIKEINNIFKQKNIFTLFGLPEIGKTVLALNYSKVFLADYLLIRIIRMDRINFDLLLLAKEFGIIPDSKITEKLKLKSGI